jgi:hypothetical protein
MSSPPPILDPPKINQSPPHPSSNHQYTNNTNNINYHTNNYRESDHNTTASEQNSIIPEDERQPAMSASCFPASPPNLKSQHKSLVKEAKNLKNEEHKLNSKISTLRSTIHESQLNIKAIDAQFQNQRLDQFENGVVQEEGDKTSSLAGSGEDSKPDSKLDCGNPTTKTTDQQVNNLAIFFEQLIQHAKILTKINSDEATSSNADATAPPPAAVGASENGSNSPDSQNSKIESQNFPLSSLETIFNKHPPTTAIPANLLDKIGQFSDRKITRIV